MSPSSADTAVWPTGEPSPAHRASFSEAAPEPFWLSGPRPAPRAPVDGVIDADLLIVGGGLTGLWAAVCAAEQDPGRSIALIERDTIAIGASGRNGGFMSSSLVHGIGNGMARFPEEIETLERLGLENLEAIKSTIRHHGIDCDLLSPGAIETAMTPGQLEELNGGVEELERFGHEAEFLTGEQMRAEVNSPLFTGGIWQKSGECSVNPVKLCDGLLDLAESLGVRIHEETEMLSLRRAGAGVDVATDGGTVRARRVLLATAAFRSPIRAIRSRVVPVFDYVLVTEPLTTAQWDAVGWKNRQGLSDSSNRFHYYRPTADGRILWGGYDAIYHYGGRVDEGNYQRDESFAGLAQRFFTAFPQLEGLKFTHRWGGAIDTCSRFFAFYGSALGGRVAYAVGHTGLGVGASRFSAGVALDLLDGRENEVSGTEYGERKPMPFPPEPLKWGTIQFTRGRLAAADRKDGKRGAWLNTLDRFGLGFDS
ncbi:MAG: FAD-dependent oxidoreductase [Solirubrobacterales bacterium]|nr:FAD-dependent oxidoreductase [Solirubrobacterales bacterium]